EPEDLLGEITSSAVKGGKRLAVPSSTDKGKHPLEGMIHSSIERELSELSNSITQSVREIVHEITPKIVREIVKEEIDKIKNS
ncbi:MAG: response regulator, partial [Nitrospina sp.]|nr:response regulator [Nitrospina sp.]